MSSGLRLRRPVFFCRLTPLSCLSSLHRSLRCLPSCLTFSSCRPVAPSARSSLCRQLAGVCIPSGFSSAIPYFFRPPSIAVHRRPSPSIAVHRRPSPSIAAHRRPSPRRLLSVARCAVHRPALAVCCPSPVPRRPPPHLFPLPFGPDHGFCIRGIPACMSAGAACRVVPQRFRRSAFPRKSLRLPQLGRRAVSDKITPCVLLSGAIFPARSAILLTIWQRLPFGTTFVQIQDVTGAPDPQGGRTPAARKENGKI